VQRLNAQAAELERPAVVERLVPILVVSDRHLSKDGRKSMGPVRATPSAGLTLADPVAAHPRP
jgi:hypothetical protein